MTLVATRQKFVEHTGRYDLIVDTTDWADNGADWFINAGMRYLEKIVNIKNSYARHFPQITFGAWYVIIKNCRAIKEVWCSDSDYERWRLEKIDFGTLREEYNEIPSELDGGDPLYYSPVQTLRLGTETDDQMTIDYFYDTETTESCDHYDYNALILMPPADETFRLEVMGLFEHPDLSNDTDENIWTEKYPDILEMSASRSLEITYRNTQGRKDWEGAILEAVTQLGMDLVEEEVAEVSQMEG